jgi:hypothetical protein
MQTNPNIILSGNQMAQPRLPDVNAMMQTRTAGMENIYKIEQARAEEAKAAQKEQEAAAVEAMLPSVVAAYSDPSDAGLDQAVALMPAEVRDTFAPFVSRLKTVRDPAARKAIIEAELAMDEAGRAVLDRVPTAIQRMNADIQRGQLDVSRQRLAQDVAAANQPPQVSPDKAAELAYKREKDAADRAAEAAMPEGMDPKTKVKFEQAYPKSASALRTSVTGMDNTLVALEKLIKDPGLEDISGTFGAGTFNLSAQAKRAQALFDQTKAGAGLAALVELKQSSPAGGALGNVSNQEGDTLRNSRGAFLQTQEYEDLRNALIDYYNVLERSRANIIGAFDDTYSYRGENPSAAILQAAQEQFQDIETKTKEKFGEPAATGGFRIRNVRQQ